MTKADWLRSEIEKLEGMKMPHKDWTKDEHYKTCKDGCTYCCNAEGTRCGFNQALDTIITRYKEELKVLESK